MASSTLVLLLLPPLLLAAPPSPDLILDDGYTVTTAADFNRRAPAPAPAVNPHAILPRPRAGDLLLLDSSASALYTLSLTLSGGVRRLAGSAPTGFADGGPATAAFHHPRSVAVDAADNVYVADRGNRAIRKITPSGFTTTIAGGRSSRTGHRDGPAQNATFSAEFELVYVPRMCALLVADRGNQLIRQIDLKPEDCAHESRSGLGTTSVAVTAILCVMFGSIIGFLVRHFYPTREVSINHFVSRTWRQYQTTLRKAALINFSGIKSVVANSVFYAFLLKLVRLSVGCLSIVFPSVRPERRVPCKQTVSLLDLDRTAPELSPAPAPVVDLDKGALASTEQLEDLINFNGDTETPEDNEPTVHGGLEGLLDDPQGSFKKIDHMIGANLSDFSSQEENLGSTKQSGFNFSRVSRRAHRGN